MGCTVSSYNPDLSNMALDYVIQDRPALPVPLHVQEIGEACNDLDGNAAADRYTSNHIGK